MASIALFHSVLGLRPGMHDAAERLTAAGHTVHLVDQFDGLVFDDYEPASVYAEQDRGFPALMQAAIEGVASIEGPLLVGGFSNGGGMAEFVAANRAGVTGVLLLSGALPPDVIGISWPSGVPAQVHYTEGDPFRRQDNVDAVLRAVRDAGGEVETFDYPGDGHLFADPSKTDEYQPEEAEVMWARVIDFVARVDGATT
jgi:dienelactone hydrolase